MILRIQEGIDYLRSIHSETTTDNKSPNTVRQAKVNQFGLSKGKYNSGIMNSLHSDTIQFFDNDGPTYDFLLRHRLVGPTTRFKSKFDLLEYIKNHCRIKNHALPTDAIILADIDKGTIQCKGCSGKLTIQEKNNSKHTAGQDVNDSLLEVISMQHCTCKTAAPIHLTTMKTMEAKDVEDLLSAMVKWHNITLGFPVRKITKSDDVLSGQEKYTIYYYIASKPWTFTVEQKKGIVDQTATSYYKFVGFESLSKADERKCCWCKHQNNHDSIGEPALRALFEFQCSEFHCVCEICYSLCQLHYTEPPNYKRCIDQPFQIPGGLPLQECRRRACPGCMKLGSTTNDGNTTNQLIGIDGLPAVIVQPVAWFGPIPIFTLKHFKQIVESFKTTIISSARLACYYNKEQLQDYLAHIKDEIKRTKERDPDDPFLVSLEDEYHMVQKESSMMSKLVEKCPTFLTEWSKNTAEPQCHHPTDDWYFDNILIELQIPTDIMTVLKQVLANIVDSKASWVTAREADQGTTQYVLEGKEVPTADVPKAKRNQTSNEESEVEFINVKPAGPVQEERHHPEPDGQQVQQLEQEEEVDQNERRKRRFEACQKRLVEQKCKKGESNK